MSAPQSTDGSGRWPKAFLAIPAEQAAEEFRAKILRLFSGEPDQS